MHVTFTFSAVAVETSDRTAAGEALCPVRRHARCFQPKNRGRRGINWLIRGRRCLRHRHLQALRGQDGDGELSAFSGGLFSGVAGAGDAEFLGGADAVEGDGEVPWAA